jgi:hypothetical protein
LPYSPASAQVGLACADVVTCALITPSCGQQIRRQSGILWPGGLLMELLLFLFGCAWLVAMDMRSFTGEKNWPFEEKRRVKRPDER